MILGGLRSQAWELFPGPKSVGQAWGTSLPLPHPVGGGGRALGGTERTEGAGEATSPTSMPASESGALG